MKTKLFFVAFLAIATLLANGQRPAMELTFTAVNNTTWVQLDSLKVMNRTLGCDTVLYWPDTMLSIYYVGIPEISENGSGFQVFRNYPNPVADQTTIALYVPEKDKVSIIVTDILGRVILKSDKVLDRGHHSFRFTPGGGNLYFFTAQWRGSSSSIKILNHSSRGNASTLEYLGEESSAPTLKAIEDVQEFLYSPGDELLYIGYASGLQSGMLDAPEESQAYTFQFATNIPCPGIPTVDYEGQVYNTIQIYGQCWLKENLNVGTKIQGSQGMTDNGITEKYCYGNLDAKCDLYGGLYTWNEMMQYTAQKRTQGICPFGWHLPDDEEWKVLEGAVDSHYGIGDSVWEISWDWHGWDAGLNLKTTSGWQNNGNGTDLYGFSGQPGGDRYINGSFEDMGYYGRWWSSSEFDDSYSWMRLLSYWVVWGINRTEQHKDFGFSVRCLRDN